jgi:ankyrin repeat protein
MNFHVLAGRRWLVVFVLVLAPTACQMPEELYSRANAKQERGDYRGAIEDFDRVLSLLPDSASAYTSRGNAKNAMGDHDGAIADHSRAIGLAPAVPYAYNNRGYARQEKGDLAGAISDYESALEFDPEYAFAINNRTEALREVLSILDRAIKAGDLALVESTVAAIPSAATAADSLGWTGLHYLTMLSAGENEFAIGEFLLESGANPSARDDEGNTPLHFAGQRAGRDIDDAAYHGLIALLLANGASVFEHNGIGLTPLHHWTIFDASANAVEMLLDHGAPIRARATRDGWTPLHGAAVSGRTDLVELLLRRGATGDKLVRDSGGRTPREAALLAGQTEIAELLE